MAEKNLHTAILFCIAALATNLFGTFIAKFFDLPIFLDTIGTIFISALGGYIPGIAVGFFTNMAKSFEDPTQMYFCSISVAIAIITTFFARKGSYLCFANVLAMIVLMTLFSGSCDLLIEHLLKTNDIFAPLKGFESEVEEVFMLELLDKGISILTTFYLLKFISPQTKSLFRNIGQRQAPLLEEMKHISDEKNYLSSSLRTKMLVILTLSSLLLSFSVAAISYLLFRNSTIEDRVKTVNSMVTIVVSEINPYSIDNFLKQGRDAVGYTETEQKLYTIKNSTVDAKYLYVYRFDKEGCHVIFDLNTAAYEGDKVGQIIEPEKSVKPYLDDLIAGKPIRPIISNDEYGYLLTLYKPVYDSAGKCQCYAAIDLSMDALSEYTRTFVLKLLALFLGCFVFIFAIGISFIENNIILPMNTMTYCAKNFSYDEESREKYFEKLFSLQIQTGDEIENLYVALLRMSKNILTYFENLKKADMHVANMEVKVAEMDEIAYKDSLTGVQNKAAYDRKIAELDVKIAEGTASFSIVMIDVNFLKKVNDTYGHERGNEYLINACKLVSAIFGEEHVYRIGGDEFVVVIEDKLASLCKYFAVEFKYEMDGKKNNPQLQPWEKISAALGIATFEAGVDKNAEEVFKRADALMYENKLAMKAARTD